MKHYLTEITTYVDGTNDSYAVYAYADKTAAIAAFHQKMGGAMRNANYASELLCVMDSYGNTVRNEKFVRDAE